MHQILMIDDDISLCKLLKNNLEKEGYSVCMCHDGEAGLREARRTEYQLIILDIMLPIKDGFEVLTQIRKNSHVPILMLTAKDNEGDKVAALRMGADDYLTKPFSNSEFVARVSSILRRYLIFNIDATVNNIIEMGNLTIDISKHEVHNRDILIELTAKEFELLLFFAKSQGQVFTKRQIYNAVWNNEYAYDDNNIMVHIRRLRKKIEDDPSNPRYILTVWGIGYKSGGTI